MNPLGMPPTVRICKSISAGLDGAREVVKRRYSVKHGKGRHPPMGILQTSLKKAPGFSVATPG